MNIEKLFYKLDTDGNTPIVGTLETIDSIAVRRVASTILPRQHCIVSTVFLGIVHGADEAGRPLLWETMVFPFGGDLIDIYCERCSGNRHDAQQMHDKVVAKMQSSVLGLRIDESPADNATVKEDEHRKLST